MLLFSSTRRFTPHLFLLWLFLYREIYEIARKNADNWLSSRIILSSSVCLLFPAGSEIENSATPYTTRRLPCLQRGFV